MSLRVIVLVLVAVGAALGTVVFARSWIDAQRAAITARVPPPESETPAPEILVTKVALPAGSFVKPEHLRWQPWPDENLADAYVVKGTREMEEFIGAVARNGIVVGQPITDGAVVKPGDRGFLAAVLEPGKRAISVSINATTGISGFVFPGDRVDLILTQNLRESAEGEKSVRRASETVLGDLRVLAVDQTTNDQENEPAVAKTVTLEVTPKQAEVITVAAELGKLSLSLRSLAFDEKNGVKVAPRRTHTWDSEASRLLPPPAVAGAASRTVHVVRGEKSETQEFRRRK